MSIAPEQLKTKWLKDGSVDGNKIKIKKNQSIKGTAQDGSEVELLKLNLSDKVEVLGSEIVSVVELAAETSQRQINDGVIDNKINEEIISRMAETAELYQKVSDEEAARILADSNLETFANELSSDLAQEILDREAADLAAIAEAKGYADQKVAALVDSAPAVLDTLKELSAALGNDANFATTVSNNIGTVSSNLASEISRAQDAEQALSSSILSVSSDVSALSSSLSSEVAARENADSALDARLLKEEGLNLFLKGGVYNDAAAVYADGQPGSEDPSSLTRDGWYFKNAVAGQSINWYFFDGTKDFVTKAQMKSVFAVMIFDDKTSKPILTFYSMPTGSNDIMPGFAHSKWIYQVPVATMNNVVLGKKYLVWAGDTEPTAHPELPRLQATFVSAVSGGQMLSSELILTNSLNSDGSVAVNKTQWLVESLGVFADNFKSEAILKIKHATKASVTALSSTVSSLSSSVSSQESAISSIQSSLSTVQSDLSSEISRAQAAEAQALVDAKAYTDSSVSGKASVSYVDTQDAAKLVEAKSYADGIVATEQAAREAADTLLQAAIAAKTVYFGKSNKVLAGADSYVDLDHEAVADSLVVYCDCYPLHKDTHYTASVVSGKTRLTFINHVAPGGIQEFEAGEYIHATYLKA